MSKTAIVFPGQGSQIVGMGKDLVELSDHAGAVFNRANDILGFDLAEICFNGPADVLEQTDIQQPAILVTSLAAWSALTHKLKEPLVFAYTAGLSLGEYTALHVAGALSFEDAVRLVHKRGQFMQEAATAQPSGMVSVIGLDSGEVDALCKATANGQVLSAANFNCPGQIVLSGDSDACQRAVKYIEDNGKGRAIPLKVAGAFHSELMKPAAEKLRAELDNVSFEVPQNTVLANVDTLAHDGPENIRQRLYQQVFSPVRWQETIQKMIADGVERFIEVGPGRVLTGLMRKIDRKKATVNVSTAESLDSFVAAQ